MALLAEAQNQLAGKDTLNNTEVTYAPTKSTGVQVQTSEAPSLSDLYPEAPKAEGPDASDIRIPVTQTDKSVANVDTSGSTTTAVTQPLKDTALADQELNRITSQDNPLMQRARAEAAQFANRRGLGNSSIAAGAGAGAVVDRATPLALQNAQEINKMRQLEAQLGTQVNLFNAEQLDEANRLTAQMRAALEQQDAAAYNAA